MTTHGDGRAFVGALVLYAAFFGAFFSKSLSTDELIAVGDALDFGVAAYLSSPSLWTEGLYSGYPIEADPQSLIFYPVLQIFRLLGLGWNVFMVTPFVVASASSFLLVRRLTGSNLAAAFSGICSASAVPCSATWATSISCMPCRGRRLRSTASSAFERGTCGRVRPSPRWRSR
jgi:hypothetical protein